MNSVWKAENTTQLNHLFNFHATNKDEKGEAQLHSSS